MRNNMDCIDLRTLGDYKITYDEATDGRTDPWMRQIPCAGTGVTVYPHGGTRLAVQCDNRKATAKRLEAIDGVTLHQDGDRDKTFVFDVSLWEQVRAVVRPRRNRRLCPERKAASARRRSAGPKTVESTGMPRA